LQAVAYGQPDTQGAAGKQLFQDAPADRFARGRVLAPGIALVRIADAELLAGEQSRIGFQRDSSRIAFRERGQVHA